MPWNRSVWKLAHGSNLFETLYTFWREMNPKCNALEGVMYMRDRTAQEPSYHGEVLSGAVLPHEPSARKSCASGYSRRVQGVRSTGSGRGRANATDYTGCASLGAPSRLNRAFSSIQTMGRQLVNPHGNSLMPANAVKRSPYMEWMKARRTFASTNAPARARRALNAHIHTPLPNPGATPGFSILSGSHHYNRIRQNGGKKISPNPSLIMYL